MTVVKHGSPEAERARKAGKNLLLLGKCGKTMDIFPGWWAIDWRPENWTQNGVAIKPHGLWKTLPKRQISNGLAEAVKVALTSDKELFDIFETKDIEENIDEIIIRSLNVKKDVVEKDEKESGLRRVLNFGHTIGHGIESTQKIEKLYHGECVALGIIPMCSEKIRMRVIEVLKKCKLYRTIDYNWEKIAEAAFHDKKADGDKVSVVCVDEIGTFEIETKKSVCVIENAKNVLEGLK